MDRCTNYFKTLEAVNEKCSVKRVFLRNFAKFTGKHLCQSLFFNKITGLRTATLLKKRLLHRCFPVNFAKFLRTPFLQNSSGRLLLKVFLIFNYLKGKARFHTFLVIFSFFRSDFLSLCEYVAATYI